MATYRYVIADVFTDVPLQGNQLAVFTDAREIPEQQLQPLAKEMNYSETVFVFKPEAEGHARIRIFTPTSELPFAGHPVLGTAFILAGPLQLPEIRLETGQGVIPIALDRDESGRIVFGRMQQPIPKVEPFDRTKELFAALGIEGSELPVELYDLGIRHVYVALPSEEAVAALEPDYAALVRLTGIVGVNCFAGSGTRWKTRMFAPADGVPEDPATGSAAGPLGVHLARHGLISFGEEIEITQGVEIGRPSKLFVRIDGSAEEVERVECGGSAVVVARGEFVL
jgi:trans-2,3-dihydro-3-hydroxyanthranilate isomerase